MLQIAFILLACAAALGGLLALGLLRRGRVSPPVWRRPTRRRVRRGFGLLHGALGLAGLVVLLAALRTAGVPAGAGTAGFGRIAAWLLGLALLFGLAILALARGRRGPTAILVAVHATLAISGVVVLMALVLLG